MGLFDIHTRSLPRTGRSSGEIPRETWDGLWRELHRLKGKKGDATIGTVRLVTRKDGTWFLMDAQYVDEDAKSICSLRYNNLLSLVAKEVGCTMRHGSYGSSTARKFTPKKSKSK